MSKYKVTITISRIGKKENERDQVESVEMSEKKMLKLMGLVDFLKGK